MPTVNDSFDISTFMNNFADILDNESLRKPQVNAYVELYKHFIENNNKSHALVVLPTGVGKTGVMGIAPYKISSGRVLIIAPRVPIKDNLIKSLDPTRPDNFWIKRNVFKYPGFLPSVCEYVSKLPKSVLDKSNIVILNAQKLQARLESSPLNFLPADYFDLIIIDEAHHSTAKTWVETINHFSNAKVIKLTGTPFRTDGEKIEGKLVYDYKLGVAMANNYVKSLENISYIPDKLYLTIDKNDSKKYTIEEIYAMNLRDEDWVSRSVAFSDECSEKIVDKSIELMQAKKANSNIPHKIIAVACSIEHAKQIKNIYEGKGQRVTLIHSELDELSKERAFSDIENNRVDVVVNIAMLGEGYDHPYLSVAAIFRPFKTELPYVQFIGRILRYINDENATATDNIGHIVSHKYLELDDLWNKYKKEIESKDIIKELTDESNDYSDEEPDTNNGNNSNTNTIELGNAFESSSGKTITDHYINTELLEKVKQLEEEDLKKANELVKILGITQAQAEFMVKSSKADSRLKRPDQLYLNTKSAFDSKIKEEIVPELILEYDIDKDSKSLLNILPFFKERNYYWIGSRAKNNLAILSIYFTHYCNTEIGRKREKWSQEDFELAYQKLDDMVEYIKRILD